MSATPHPTTGFTGSTPQQPHPNATRNVVDLSAARQRRVNGTRRTANQPQPGRLVGDFPPPQDGPTEGTMVVPPGFQPLDLPGRCVDCGFHVPTQLHRQFCPRTGQTAQEAQHPKYARWH